MLPVADPDRLGECQPLGSERLLGQLEAVERGIVRAELEVERHLLLEDLAAVADHAGDVAAVLGLSRLTPRDPTQSSIQTSNGWRRTPPDEQS